MTSKKNENHLYELFNEIKLNNLVFDEAKENDYDKKNLILIPKYTYDNGVIAQLFIKTPMVSHTKGGLPPMRDKEKNLIDYGDGGRAQWNFYFGDSPDEKVFQEKMEEIQEKILKEKLTIIGKNGSRKDDKKIDEKKFEFINMIKEDKNSQNFMRFKFKVDYKMKEKLETKFYELVNNKIEEVNITSINDFESKYKYGTFKYRMVVKMKKIWVQKMLPSKFGVGFDIEQMLIEPSNDVNTSGKVNIKNMMLSSQFDDDDITEINKKTSEIEISKKSDDDADDEEDDEEDDDVEEEEIKSTKNKSKIVKSTKKDDSEEDDDEDEIKSSKKVASSVKAKPVRRKAGSVTSSS
jgi:hypothetical protein